MQVRGAGEALFIACEMEKHAIRLYERALTVFADSSCREAVRAILTDERNHLARFSEMGGETPGFERARLLSAQATGMLFSGAMVLKPRCAHTRGYGITASSRTMALPAGRYFHGLRPASTYR